jgi:SAM-dependent methyltransferase
MTTSQIQTDLILAYNRQAAQRDKNEMQAWKIPERAEFLTLLKRERKQSLLEVGAGHGRDSRFFQENGFQVTCTDLSPEMVKLCQQKGLNASVMDMLDLGFPDNSFDAVYSLNNILHLTKKELPIALQSIWRVLKANSLFFLGVYGGDNFEGIWEKDSYRPKRFFSFHTDEKLKEAVTVSFELLSFKQIMAGMEDLHFQSIVLRKPVS